MLMLLTGGAGYIGSHLLIDLLQAGHDVVVLDDLSGSSIEAIARAETIAGRRCRFVEGSLLDANVVRRALEGVDVVFHLAAFKRVDESVAEPGRYFANNVGGMSVLLGTMEQMGIRRIVFSSSAAVYGSQDTMPLHEDLPLRPDSPYGLTKQLGEQMLDEMATHKGWAAVSLRYFNPVGAHPSGLVGEALCKAMSLVPRTLQAVLYPHRPLTIFGTDYDTPDGTCQRDYVHVCDVARAHLVAIEALALPGHHIYNVGTGRPYSVREVIDACGIASGRLVPHAEGARRPGDIPVAVAACDRFRYEHGFVARYDLQDMVNAAWHWSSRNPDSLSHTGPGRGIRAARDWALAELSPPYQLSRSA
jgi:UDP-glucose 4-epimerase